MATSSTTKEFDGFYTGWLVDQQRLLDQLIRLSSQNDDVLNQEDKERLVRSQIEEVLCHYKRYYEEKAKAMSRENELGCSLLLLFFSPPWITSLEKVSIWMGGFKPSFALSLLEVSVTDLTPEQKARLEAVRQEVEVEIKAVEDDKERIHEGILNWPAPQETGGGDVAVEEVKEAMRAVMMRADKVRQEMVVKAVESLSGWQTVKFLVAVGSYHLGMRSLGVNFPL